MEIRFQSGAPLPMYGNYVAELRIEARETPDADWRRHIVKVVRGQLAVVRADDDA